VVLSYMDDRIVQQAHLKAQKLKTAFLGVVVCLQSFFRAGSRCVAGLIGRGRS
jgi:hypothetical protein